MHVFVPTVIVPPRPPSPEAREVGARVAELVHKLREENPDLSARDIRTGLLLAEHSLRGKGSDSKVLVLSLVLGLSAALGVLIFVYNRAGNSPIGSPIVMVGIVSLLVLMLAVFAVLRRK